MAPPTYADWFHCFPLFASKTATGRREWEDEDTLLTDEDEIYSGNPKFEYCKKFSAPHDEYCKLQIETNPYLSLEELTKIMDVAMVRDNLKHEDNTESTENVSKYMTSNIITKILAGVGTLGPGVVFKYYHRI